MITTTRGYYFATLLLALLVATPLQVSAQSSIEEQIPLQTKAEDPFTPNVFPKLTISATERAIVIDGSIGNAEWAGAAQALNFSETFPEEQVKPPIDIRGYFTYDEANLYVAVKIKDDPSAIRANLSDRDQIWQDDYVGLALDTNGDGQEVYFIAVNPFGIQGDTRISRNDEDLGFNLVYSSEGQITEDGYEVELKIPFRSLRFPDTEEQAWRATIWVTHPRDSRNTYSWSAVDRDNPCWPCQFGYLEGVKGVKSGGNLEILPTLTGSQASSLNDGGDAYSGFDHGRLSAEPSLDVKYGITSDVTADVSVNPDFSQIEADAAQIDVNSTFALFFPERRPFFQEGSDLFDTYISTVYTRSINDPIVASKLTGRFGSTNVAYIGARDNTSPLLLPFEENSELLSVGKSFSNVLRVMHNFKNNSFIGGLVTDRRLDGGGGGSTFALDTSLRFWTKYRFAAQVVGSATQELNDPVLSSDLDGERFDNGRYTSILDGESFTGTALYAEFEREARHWFFEFEYEQYSPTFRADNGFINQNNVRDFTIFQGYSIYPEKIAFIDRISPRMAAGRTWNFDGLKKEDWVFGGMFLQMKGQTNVFLGYELGREQFQGVDFDNLSNFEMFLSSGFSETIQLRGFAMTGRSIARNVETPEVGDNLFMELGGTIRPTQRLKLEPEFNFARLKDRQTGDEFFRGYIARMRVNYQFSRRFFLRTVFQYNDFAESFEVDPLLTYRINPFTAFYVGSTHDYNTFDRRGEQDASRFLRQSERQFFFKFQYQIRT